MNEEVMPGQMNDVVLHRVDRLEETVGNFITKTFPDTIREFSEKFDVRAIEDRREMDRRFEALLSRSDKTRPDFFRIMGLLAGAIGIGITILGGYGNLALSHASEDIHGLTEAGKATDARIEKWVDRNDARFQRVYDTFMPVSEVKLRFDSNKDAIAGKVDRAVFDEYRARIDSDISRLVEALRRSVDKNASDFLEIRNKLVSREENQFHWDEFGRQMLTLQNQIDNVRRDFGSDYTIGDQVKELQSRLNEIQQSLLQLAPNMPTPSQDKK